MSDTYKFRELKLNNKPIYECEMVIEVGDYRLYIDRVVNGFYAMAVEFSQCEEEDVWNCPRLLVGQLFNVTALFDGVRHLEFDRDGDMAGYIYYPNISNLVVLFQKVREIELVLCRDCD